MKNQKGFSLVELLVVVIIIAIIAAIAIPSLLASRRAANEASAIQSLRTIHSAEITYFATLGNNTDYAPLADLDDSTNGSLIDATLAAGEKSGYNFTLNEATGVYCATALPDTGAGFKGFAISDRGVLYSFATPSAATTACPATGVFVDPPAGGVVVGGV